MREGRGWLVTYQHGERGATGAEMQMEARVAVMRGQWGWAVYAVHACKAGQRVGWYAGDVVSKDEWEGLRGEEGREHTVRGLSGWVNGIDGVAGMQYVDASHGREARERATGRPEAKEKVRIATSVQGIVVKVKERERVVPGEEMRMAYGWSPKAWARVCARADSGEGGGVRRGWKVGDRRGMVGEDRRVVRAAAGATWTRPVWWAEGV